MKEIINRREKYSNHGKENRSIVIRERKEKEKEREKGSEGFYINISTLGFPCLDAQ